MEPNALHNLVRNGAIDAVTTAITARPHDVKARDHAGRTPLHIAAASTYTDSDVMLAALLDLGADVNVQDDIGWTPLHHAARGFSLNNVDILFRRGARLDIVDKEGRTALDVAPDYVHRERIRILARTADDNTASRSKAVDGKSDVVAARPLGDSLSPGAKEIYARVMESMQSAEELGGPEGDDYVALMEAIAGEAAERAKTFLAIRAAEESDATLTALSGAEDFISGFEDDETQEGIPELLEEIRDAIEREQKRMGKAPDPPAKDKGMSL